MGLEGMSSSEQKLAVIKDVILPIDVNTRYDVYFTDKRIAIVCMGNANHIDQKESGHPYLMSQVLGGPPPATTDAEYKLQRKQLEEEINALSLDDVLKLSKKSCFYTYSEIEKLKLISGKKPKLVILSEECISKFSPNQEQFMQLYEFLPKIEALKGKISLYGDIAELKPLGEDSTAGLFCKYCGYNNDADALWCQSCGKKLKEQSAELENPAELTCGSCGAKNKVQASFCKKCGAPFGVKL